MVFEWFTSDTGIYWQNHTHVNPTTHPVRRIGPSDSHSLKLNLQHHLFSIDKIIHNSYHRLVRVYILEQVNHLFSFNYRSLETVGIGLQNNLRVFLTSPKKYPEHKDLQNTYYTTDEKQGLLEKFPKKKGYHLSDLSIFITSDLVSRSYKWKVIFFLNEGI